MNLKTLKRNDLDTIENAFRVLKENPDAKEPMKIIGETLENTTNHGTFTVRVSSREQNKEKPLFVMSVFPTESVISKIVEAITVGKGNLATVRTLWNKNTSWIIEIDELILGKMSGSIDLTPEELTAVLLHELGHVNQDNAMLTRAITIIQYEYSKMKLNLKALCAYPVFRNIFSLPVLDGCATNLNPDGLRKEAKADAYARKMGYSQPLLRAIEKILKAYKVNALSPDANMQHNTEFAVQTLSELEHRKDALIKDKLQKLKDNVPSDVVKEYIEHIYDCFCVDETMYENHQDYLMAEGAKDRLIDKEIGESKNKFFSDLMKKKMEKIDSYDLDYISVKIDAIKSDADKLVLLGYIHNKLETVCFYLDVLQDSAARSKYRIPHTKDELERMKTQLTMMRELCLKKKLPPKMPDIYVAYPSGYEG